MFNKVHYTIRKQFQISKKKIRQAFTPLKISNETLIKLPDNNQDNQDNKHSPKDPKNNILLMFAMAFSIYICNKHTI